jgi:drug/metabolite transporter (DMT)-like permease
VTGALDKVEGSDIPFFVLVGVLGVGSYLAFYRALAIGPISLVSPIVSGYAAVTVVLAVAIGGERLSGRQSGAIAVALLGVVLASADLRLVFSERVVPLGIVLALATIGLIGAFVYGVADRQARLGWLAPIFLARSFSTGMLVAGYRLVPRSARMPLNQRVLGALAFLAVVDTAGYVSFNVGAAHAKTSIVAAASSPYAVVPILAGVFLFHERPKPSQWGGIALVVAGLVLLGLAGS